MKDLLVVLAIGLTCACIVGCGGSDSTSAPPAGAPVTGGAPGMSSSPPAQSGPPGGAAAAAPEAKPDEAAKTEPVDNSDNPWADDIKVTTSGAIGKAFLGLVPKPTLPMGPGAMPGAAPGLPGAAPPAKQ